MKEINKVLDQDEKVLWEGTPSFWPFLLGRSIIVTIFGIFWMGFMLIFIASWFTASGSFGYLFFAMPHFWIGLIMMFGPVIYNIFVFKHTYYSITDKRIIIQKGLIGRDFEMIDYDQVTNAEVNVGVFDKAFGGGITGSILVSSAGSITNSRHGTISRPYIISNVVNPYDVFKFFKKITYDVKTDIQYPNKFRPKVNPGYKIDYDPEKK